MGKLKRIWAMLTFSAAEKVEKSMDPQTLAKMAWEKELKLHESVREAAEGMIQSRNEIDMKLARTIHEANELKAKAISTLKLADRTSDIERKREIEAAAEVLVTELAGKESLIENLKPSLETATLAAQKAKEACANHGRQVQVLGVQKHNVTAKLETAKLTEALAETSERMNNMLGTSDMPSFAQLEEMADSKMARAQAKHELNSGGSVGALQLVEAELVKESSRNRLNSLREEAGLVIEASGTASTEQIEAGTQS